MVASLKQAGLHLLDASSQRTSCSLPSILMAAGQVAHHATLEGPQAFPSPGYTAHAEKAIAEIRDWSAQRPPGQSQGPTGLPRPQQQSATRHTTRRGRGSAEQHRRLGDAGGRGRAGGEQVAPGRQFQRVRPQRRGRGAYTWQGAAGTQLEARARQVPDEAWETVLHTLTAYYDGQGSAPDPSPEVLDEWTHILGYACNVATDKSRPSAVQARAARLVFLLPHMLLGEKGKRAWSTDEIRHRMHHFWAGYFPTR